jgi:hypothetical protein
MLSASPMTHDQISGLPTSAPTIVRALRGPSDA